MKKNILIKLVKRMQEHDEDAFNEIYAEFYDPLFYLALEMTHNEADAKDVVQNTWVQVNQSIDQLNEPSVFILWMKRILLNKCRNLYRARKNMLYNDDLVIKEMERFEKSEDQTVKSVRFDMNKQMLHQLVHSLTDIQEEVIVLHYFEQMKIKEIAILLNISEGTVKSRLNAAKGNLRKLCADYEIKHNEKITMHTFGIHGVLTLFYAKMKFLRLWKKGSISCSSLGYPAWLIPVASIAVISSTGIVIFSKMAQQEDQAIILRTLSSPKEPSDQDAYYQLRTWSHCKDEMREKDKHDFDAIYPYFQQLQEYHGRYWMALQEDQWAQNFIELYEIVDN